MVTSRSVILATLLCVAYAYPPNYEKKSPAGRDLNTAETIWDLFNQGGRGYSGYSGWGTGVQSSPVVASPYSLTSYPANYGTYPTYATYGNNYYGKYPSVAGGSVYPGYANSFPTYENYAIHGGHGFGKYGKY